MGISVYTGALRWALLRKKYSVPTLMAVQLLFCLALLWGVPMIVGNGAALDASNVIGVWHLGVIAVSVTLAPQMVCESKGEGYFRFLTNFPISRAGIFIIEVLSWFLISLPGLAVTPILGVLRYSPAEAAPGPLLVTAVCALELCYMSIGVGVALTFRLEIVQVLSQIFILFAMLFSPIVFPETGLPDILMRIHTVLPFKSAQDTLVAARNGAMLPMSFCVVLAWGCIGAVSGIMALSRRK
ncbi:ABC transporter permease [Actinomyces qiguomingii]|uniref:ABC transporter permease n=1 Tax=Actinomyces qiguomingii TaxID=2057800 RepID=UPI000CA0712C|nr:ABC transporter permease [Actinomyces qiguomingii]